LRKEFKQISDALHSMNIDPAPRWDIPQEVEEWRKEYLRVKKSGWKVIPRAKREDIIAYMNEKFEGVGAKESLSSS